MGLKVVKLILGLLVLMSSTSCTNPNIYEEFSQTKNSYEAILEEARLYIDESQFDSALAELNTLSSANQAKTEAILLFVSAYSGKCGISFTRVADALSGSTSGSLLEVATSMAHGLGTTDLASCNLAKAKLDLIPPAEALADSKIQLVSFILGFVRLGLIGKTLDTNNNGLLDDARSACTVAHLSDANVVRSLSSLTMVIQNVTAFGASNIPGVDLSTVLTTIQASCPMGQTCLTVDESSVTIDSGGAGAPLDLAITLRSIFASNELGTKKAGCSISNLASNCCQ